MNGAFDLNGQSEGITGLSGTGTITNSASSTTAILTFGTFPAAQSADRTPFPASLATATD